MDDRRIYRGINAPSNRIELLAQIEAPPWRQFTEDARRARGTTYKADDQEIELVNVALYLRRPLLITGRPGTGKSSLAYAVASELQLGSVLLWPITTRSTLQQGLYSYDAIARIQDASLQHEGALERKVAKNVKFDIGRYIRLGPLGTALLPSPQPRVLLIDEIDKSDIDLPNDLLHIFEEGEFEIPELARLPEEEEFKYIEVLPYDGNKRVRIERGFVRCNVFPFVVLTSNGEREFPPAFLRRCLRLHLMPPDELKLSKIVISRLNPSPEVQEQVDQLIKEYLDRRDNQKKDLSTDQLLNAIYLVMKGIDPLKRDKAQLLEALLKSLSDEATT